MYYTYKEKVPISDIRKHALACNSVSTDGNESSDEDSFPADSSFLSNDQTFETLSTSVVNVSHIETNCFASCEKAEVISGDEAGPSKITWSAEFEKDELEDAALL